MDWFLAFLLTFLRDFVRLWSLVSSGLRDSRRPVCKSGLWDFRRG